MTTLPRDHAAALHELLQDEYGLRGELRALPGEHDRNVRVHCADGCDALLKVMRAGCAEDLVDLQVDVLDHLQRTAPDLRLPRVVRTRAGRARTTVALGGAQHLAWLCTFVPGPTLADLGARSAALLHRIGGCLGRLDRALLQLPAATVRRAERELPWDLRRAAWIGDHVFAIADPARRAIVAAIHRAFTAEWQHELDALRRGVIHGDGNDHNIVIARGDDGEPAFAGLIDFGDVCRSALVGECAIAAAYAAMGAADPLAAVAAVTAGYHQQLPLLPAELDLVVPLVLVRLATSVVNSAVQARRRPDEPYLTVSEAAAWQLLLALHGVDRRIGAARVRAACGQEPWPRGRAVAAWLRAESAAMAPVFGPALPVARAHVLDLSFGSLLGGDDPESFDAQLCAARIDAELARAGASVGLGRYGEPRPIYPGPAFGGDAVNARRRTVHLGIDLFAPAGTAVHAPLAGEVALAQHCPGRLDYGGLVVLRHRTPDGEPFATLYGHLDPRCVQSLRQGQAIARGEAFAVLGAPPANGDWPPHLHLQLCADDPARGPAVPDGVAEPDAFAAHGALCPDPSPLLGLQDDRAVCRDAAAADAIARRAAVFAANVKLSYRAPLQLVRGWRHFVYDARGRRHLDAYNNVPHVGHAEPRISAAIADQTRLLATNTRYLCELPLRYAERLCALLPPSLSVCLFVNSGSEANELAVRLCRAHTGARDMLVMAHGYHGNTTGAMDLSPYKWRRGAPDWVHATVQPDVYRGEHRGDDAGARYAAQFCAQLGELRAQGRAIAGYLCECLPSVGGQLVLPRGFLPAVYAAVRAAGGLCVADDVQTALFRTGRPFGFEQQQVVPDVLVLGKPLGNGYPLAAVVTTKTVAASFARDPEFFSTFGGNTVACAAGLAVLDVLAADRLADHATQVGDRLLAGLRDLARRHEPIGDVRGLGLFVGVDLVDDRELRTPATDLAARVKERLRERRILVGTDGPHDNVLKIRPPMTFDAAAADLLVTELDAVLRDDAVLRRG